MLYRLCSRKTNPILTSADVRKMSMDRIKCFAQGISTVITITCKHLYLNRRDSFLFKPQPAHPRILYHNSCCKYPTVAAHWSCFTEIDWWALVYSQIPDSQVQAGVRGVYSKVSLIKATGCQFSNKILRNWGHIFPYI